MFKYGTRVERKNIALSDDYEQIVPAGATGTVVREVRLPVRGKMVDGFHVRWDERYRGKRDWACPAEHLVPLED